MSLMTSNKPYLIRAVYDWILDNNCTPYIIVDATLPFTDVPTQFIDEGKIILNILPSAIHQLILGNEWITFSARFSGVPENISVPIGSVIAIYAQENSQGMGFETEALPEDYLETKLITKKSKSSTNSLRPVDKSLINSVDSYESEEDTNNKDKKNGSKPNLTIIK